MRVELNEGFKQVVVWPGTLVEPERVPEFVTFMHDEFGVRVQYLESITTKPDMDKDGDPIIGTGGRVDVFFAVHEDDISGSFCVNRLIAGMRWIEDVLDNDNGQLYPSDVKEYRCW